MVETRTQTASNSVQEAGKKSSRRAVLVVDDDEALATLLRTILRMANYEVTTAVNGRDALEATRKQQADIIVLDMRVPVVDGRGFFQDLRASGDRTPVLVTSSFGAKAAQQALGAEGSIEKPFDPEELLQAVDDVLKACSR